MKRLKYSAILLTILSITSMAWGQAQLAGDWTGTLNVNGQDMHLAWHVKATPEGAINSTFDNITQQVYGIKTKTLTLAGSKVTATVDDKIQVNGEEVNVVGSMDATLSSDGNEINGTFTQTQPPAPTMEITWKREQAVSSSSSAKPDANAALAKLAGDWKGVLSAGGMELHLILHLTVAPHGALTGTLDSVDQGANGIPVSSAALKDGKLSLTVDAVHGTYEATVNPDASEMKGTWSQGQPLELNFTRAADSKPSQPAATNPAAAAATPSDIDGYWSGKLDAGDIKLPLVLKIANTAEGLTVQMHSPDQSPAWFPAKITRTGADVTVTLAAMGVEYKAKLAADLQSMEGTFTQGGVPRPLSLKYSKEVPVAEHRRPQNPVKPYPYREEEVSYANPAGDKLAATLTLPQGKGPFPAVVLIQGSGRHERDEDVLQHKPFLVLADYLTRHGVVVLRADKRGVGKSGGKFETATTADFADDAEAGFRYLQSRTEVDKKHIGLVGHSEGGTIAPVVAARNQNVAFIVLLAGTAVNGAEIIAEQQKLVALANGEPKDSVEKHNAEQKQVLEIVRTEKDPAEAEKKIRALGASLNMPQQQLDAQVKTFTDPWFRYFVAYEPAAALRQVKCPVLALNGSLDLQVPPAQNLPPMRAALASNKHAEIEELPGLNHLFQPAKTGSPAEYVQIEETMSPAVLEKVARWIEKQQDL